MANTRPIIAHRGGTEWHRTHTMSNLYGHGPKRHGDALGRFRQTHWPDRKWYVHFVLPPGLRRSSAWAWRAEDPFDASFVVDATETTSKLGIAPITVEWASAETIEWWKAQN